MNDQANQSLAVASRVRTAIGAVAVLAAIAATGIPGRADAASPAGTTTARTEAWPETATPTISTAPSSLPAHAVTGGS
jgi:hypothetical protein